MPSLFSRIYHPTQSGNPHPRPRRLQSRASSCLGTSCQKREHSHSGTWRGGRGGQGGGAGDHNIEGAMILEPLQNIRNPRELVSITNDCNQTLVHFTVLFSVRVRLRLFDLVLHNLFHSFIYSILLLYHITLTTHVQPVHACLFNIKRFDCTRTSA